MMDTKVKVKMWFKVAKFNWKGGKIRARDGNRKTGITMLIGNSNGMVASYSLGNGEPLLRMK